MGTATRCDQMWCTTAPAGGCSSFTTATGLQRTPIKHSTISSVATMGHASACRIRSRSGTTCLSTNQRPACSCICRTGLIWVIFNRSVPLAENATLGHAWMVQVLIGPATGCAGCAGCQISGGALSLGVCGRRDFGLLTVAPIIGASALLGERARWVSVSRQRFTRLRLGSEGGSVGVSVQPGERAMVTWATP